MRTPKALLVGWDGVRHDVVRALRPPALAALAADGFEAAAWMPPASVARTETAPGWATVLTGVWPGRHGVTANTPMPTALDRHPDVLTRLHRLAPDLETFAATGAAMLGADLGPGPILGDGVDRLAFHDRRRLAGGIAESDPLVLADALAELGEGDPDLAFVYLGASDHAGHVHGGASQAYRDAVLLQDERLGLLLGAVRGRPSYGEEDWLVVVTTDHGHTDEGGHGGDSWQERQSFVVAAGGALVPREEVRSVDIAPTLLFHLLRRPVTGEGFDGTPLQHAHRTSSS